jgi:hypothetical protein
MFPVLYRKSGEKSPNPGTDAFPVNVGGGEVMWCMLRVIN